MTVAAVPATVDSAFRGESRLSGLDPVHSHVLVGGLLRQIRILQDITRRDHEARHLEDIRQVNLLVPAVVVHSFLAFSRVGEGK
jgi:hypothetical protein